MRPQILIAGIGNIFLGDDAFGVQVAQRLAEQPLPEGVQVADYGTSGMHLAYDLLGGYATTLLIDALPRGGEPGTLYLLEVDTEQTAQPPVLDAHGMQPDAVLALLRTLGGDAEHVLVLGCEPGCVDEGIGLSPAVAAAVEPAMARALRLVRDELSNPGDPHAVPTAAAVSGDEAR